jgi:hypothetical protein
MRGSTGRLLALFVCTVLCFAAPSSAALIVVMGDSWGGPSKNLQAVVDGLYGAGRIDVTADFLGEKAGEPDPWSWVDNRFSALLVKQVAGNADYNQVGWYEETGRMPVLKNDGVHDGLLFDGPSGQGTTAIVRFRKPVSRFGFYLNPNGPRDAVNAPEPERFFTNRRFNDAGPDGCGALHYPAGGDLQALVFDISSLKGQSTWLVCFEDLDSGATPGPMGQAQTDNDYSDFVFEVTAFSTTAVDPLSFGALKAKYAR